MEKQRKFERLNAVCAALMVLASSAGAFAARTPMIKVVNLTGDATYTDGKGMVHQLQSGKSIPAGATILVESGAAVLRVWSTVIKAQEGDSFLFDAATQETRALKRVSVKKTYYIQGLSGVAQVTFADGRTQTLAKGQKIELSATKAVEAAAETEPEPAQKPPPPSSAQNLTESQSLSPSSP